MTKKAFDHLSAFDLLEVNAFDDVDLPAEDKVLLSKELRSLIQEELTKRMRNIPVGEIIASAVKKALPQQNEVKNLEQRLAETKESLQNAIEETKKEKSDLFEKLKDKYAELKNEILQGPRYQFGGFAPPLTTGHSGQFLTNDGVGGFSWGSPVGGVTGVSNIDGTLTISPTTGAVVASLNLSNSNTWGGIQTFGSIIDSGLTSGRVVFAAGGGALADSANMTFASAQLTLGVGNTAAGSLRFFMGTGVQTITIQPPSSAGSSYNITLPQTGTSSGVWVNSGGGTTTFQSQLALNMGGTAATLSGGNRIFFMNAAGNAFTNDSAFTFATPKLQIVAATTSGASLNTPAGTAPTSPVEGDTWNDSTQKSVINYVDGIKQPVVGAIFTQTADKSVTNTTTETTIFGTGTGTLTLPAAFFTVGKTIRIMMSGVYSTVAVTGDTVTIKVKYGSTVIASKATTSLVTGATNSYWFAEVLITCRTTGSSGTVQISGGTRYQITANALVEDELNNSVGTTTINTTTSNALDVTVTHGTADAANTVKSLVATVEVLN